MVPTIVRWYEARNRLDVLFLLGASLPCGRVVRGIYFFGEPILFLFKLVTVHILINRCLTLLIPRWQATIDP